MNGGKLDVATVDDFLQFCRELSRGGGFRQGEFIVLEVVCDLGDAGVDFNAGVAGFVLVTLGYALFLLVPLFRVNGEADALHHTSTADEEGNPDGGFAGFVNFWLYVESCFHTGVVLLKQGLCLFPTRSGGITDTVICLVRHGQIFGYFNSFS